MKNFFIILLSVTLLFGCMKNEMMVGNVLVTGDTYEEYLFNVANEKDLQRIGTHKENWRAYDRFVEKRAEEERLRKQVAVCSEAGGMLVKRGSFGEIECVSRDVFNSPFRSPLL